MNLFDNNTFISLGERINCTGAACITACQTLHSTINPQTTLGPTINSADPCLVIIKNVTHQPHCDGNPVGNISVSLSRPLCMRYVPCPRRGSQRGCSCCEKPQFKYSKCKEECSYCATGNVSYGKFSLILLRGRYFITVKEGMGSAKIKYLPSG